MATRSPEELSGVITIGVCEMDGAAVEAEHSTLGTSARGYPVTANGFPSRSTADCKMPQVRYGA